LLAFHQLSDEEETGFPQAISIMANAKYSGAHTNGLFQFLKSGPAHIPACAEPG
jgi:hypothetical protein